MRGIRPNRRRKIMKFAKHQKTMERRNRRSCPKKKKGIDICPLPKSYTGGKQISIKPKTSSQKNMAYTGFQIQRVVGFRDIYPEEPTPPSIDSLLKSVPRESLLKVAQTLINLYKNANAEDMQKFFSPDNQKLKEEFNKRFLKSKKNGESYNFCTLQTPIELLKHAFAIPYERKELKENEFEERLLKVILIINDKLTDYTYDSNSKSGLEKMAELMVVNSFSQKDINNFNLFEVFREMLTKSIDLFEYVSSDIYFAPIYQRFLEKLKIQSYKEYIITILSLFTIIYQSVLKNRQNKQIEQWAGTFVYDPKMYLDGLINTNVLDYISLGIEKDIMLEENEDYRFFRDKPLIKLPNGAYEISNIGFLLERLFYSLYFDFKTIAKELDIKGFEDQYKQSFMEKTLLCRYLEKINYKNKYKAMSSKDCLAIKGKNDSGEPDYYMKSKSGNIILFENKDILINGKIKESRNFNKIISEYKNKLLLKTYKDKGVLKTPKPEGIGQLIEQIKKIQNNSAFWDKEASSENIVYPVLVVGDSRLLPDGMSYLMQKWYEERCVSEHIDLSHIRPLIVLSISTLLLYAKEFESKGIEYYFEQYYKSLDMAKKRTDNPLLKASNLSVSFSEYMKNVYPKDFSETYELYKKKIS